MKDTQRKYIFISLISLILLFLITLMLEFFQPLNLIINQYISSLQSSFFIKIFSGITFLGSKYFIALIVAVIVISLLLKKKIKLGLFIGIVIVIGTYIQSSLKLSLQILRPEVSEITGFSFPSGHTFSSALTFWLFAFLIREKYPKLSLVLIFIPLIIGFSRIYLQVHWFTDVIGGFLLALFWLFASIPYLYKIKEN